MRGPTRCYVCSREQDDGECGPEVKCPQCGARGSVKRNGPAPRADEDDRSADRAWHHLPSVPRMMRDGHEARLAAAAEAKREKTRGKKAKPDKAMP